MKIRKNKVIKKKKDAMKGKLCENCEPSKRQLKRRGLLNNIIGKSNVIQELHKKINLVSLCHVNVLISGDSGTGKELTARAIHCASSRAKGPFIPVNCGAIPENLFENDLFSHVKGAFTDARFKQNGLVEAAEGGTLFLDEICDINPHIQIKFLRFLEDRQYKLLGDTRPHKANIRIIAATNRNLLDLVQEGSFREDLFYRLNIISLNMPPLRERRDDIPTSYLNTFLRSMLPNLIRILKGLAVALWKNFSCTNGLAMCGNLKTLFKGRLSFHLTLRSSLNL